MTSTSAERLSGKKGRPGELRPSSRRLDRRNASGLPWIMPAIVLAVAVVYYGIGYTGYISTLKWDGSSAFAENVGLGNFARAFTDPVFWKAIQHTLSFFVVTFCAQVVIGMFFAVLLHSRIRLSVLYRVVIFIPVVLAPSVMAPVFREVFGKDGALNQFLEFVGLGFAAQPWLAQSDTALYAVMSINIWEWTGLAFILYFAGISQIDPDILEAARLDGAGNFRVVVSIIFPCLSSTTVTLAMLDAIKSLKTFDIPYLLVGGGPNYSTEFMGTMVFRQTITNSNVGYGASLSLLLLALAVTMGLILQIRSGRERRRV
jgi:ABC-type sugar transport system permease subunit